MPAKVNFGWNWLNNTEYRKSFKNLLFNYLSNIGFVVLQQKKTYPYSWGEDNKDSVEDDQDGEKAQKKEPEPEEDVDFLIHWGEFKFKI